MIDATSGLISAAGQQLLDYGALGLLTIISLAVNVVQWRDRRRITRKFIENLEANERSIK